MASVTPGSTTPAKTAAGAVRLEVGPNGIAWLILDTPGSPVNILSSDTLEAIDRILDEASRRDDIQALAVLSGKPKTFIAGADVAEIGAIRTVEEATAKARRGQAILDRFATLGKPTLAAIHGPCLGGGLELALACSFRIAVNESETRLGLPEVRLGIIPGFGGTQRLPRLVGLPAAMDLILTGKTIGASRAERIGLVDRIVPAPYLRGIAENWLRHAIGTKRHHGKWARLLPRRRIPAAARLMAAPPMRPVVLSAARRRLHRTLKGVYPAPFVALHAIDAAFRKRLEAGLAVEAGLVGKLIVSPTSKNLTWLFTATNDARREKQVIDPATGAEVSGHPVQRAAVLGAGIMGGGIAHLLAEHGVMVRLKDVSPDAILKGLQAAAGLVKRAVARRRIDRREADRRMARIGPTLTWDGFRSADMVIEAVVEDLTVKRTVLAETEAAVRDDCVIATNTSSLTVGDLAAAARVPGRVVGLHFFNPVDRMPLVEVVAGEKSSPIAVAGAHLLARRLGKTPIIVKDAPGFLVNRILTSYLAEALQMFAEGEDPVEIDRAMEHFGMPMGPFALLDQVGLDTALKASRAIAAVNEKYLPNANVLPALLESGRLGLKNGRGFYRYRKGRRGRFDKKVLHLVTRGHAAGSETEAIQTRLYFPMINESVRCLRAHIARSPADVDLGLVLGAGFPPFRGGPLRNADVIGLPAVVERMNALSGKHGERHSPDPLLVEMALSGYRFYPDHPPEPARSRE
jgi:3-hydroxyacyl-CoA dehydrogenase/enoyl-CoA hydratase/3-hydroxybutyryl-CoA epimerase